MKVFKEEQRFTQIWLIVILLISIIVPITVIVKEYLNNQVSIEKMLLFMLMIVLLTGTIFTFKLQTRIDEKGIHYQFFPFHLKTRTIYWSQIKEVYVRKYDAISEYGGWGVKGGAIWNKKKGKSINVKGNIGIQLTLKNSEKILIGTQKETAANSVLKTYQTKINKL